MSRIDHASALEKWAKDGSEGTPPVLAATVILLRDRPDQSSVVPESDDTEETDSSSLEILMLKRNSKIAFGGMWVFPGGRLDPEDWDGVEEGDDLGASRRAAEREALEECGLVAAAAAMHPFSHWTPPKTTPRRFLTWFFAARASMGEVKIDHGEIHESDWMSPIDALRRRDAGEIEIAPPTFVSLAELTAFRDVEHALSSVQQREPERFQTVIGLSEEGPVAIWHGDSGYASGDPSTPAPHHRLTMRKSAPWHYARTAKPW
jgi:8-oxo-dGTP pyrophosphatase MutT (NUDIX family)